ncbi:MAG: GNAT family N-acetyltransferase [Spirochaetales bacterium]|jgi:RimJ/RimL family protein N-acetyltransferase|nr:GNAT family N-acetyltransferase [Spirochaetales bacterium]
MIRLATKEDIAKVSMLWLDMVTELKEEWESDVESWIEITKALMDVDGYYMLIAEDNDDIVGFLDGMTYYESGIGKNIGIAKHFYLKPEYRKTGLSSEMYDLMIKIAREEDANVLEIQCHPEKLKYWEGFGFKIEQYILRMVI